jgi:hypothetical protein
MKKVLATLALLLAAGCMPHYIRGTEIPANADTEAIVKVMQQYRQALLNKDAAAVVKLLGPDFYDNGGTADPADDLTLKNVEKVLSDRLSKLADFDLEIDVKDIDVKDNGRAEAKFYYTEHFRMPGLTSQAQSEADAKKMIFQKVGEDWKITSGI